LVDFVPPPPQAAARRRVENKRERFMPGGIAEIGLSVCRNVPAALTTAGHGDAGILER
jgi:hypothetical protein